MKTQKQSCIAIILFLVVLNFSIFPPIVSSSITPGPRQFIGEIFPNCTIPLGLSHTNTIIIINATHFSKEIGIRFDANYTIYNPENTTTIPFIVPFSLAINITKFTFEVYTNNTQIPYNLFSIPMWNENATEIEIYYLPGPFDKYPIRFIRSNVTLFKNSTLIIRYHFSGLMSNPLDSRDVFYIQYYLGSSQEWIRNTTGRIEFRIYGRQPIFNFGWCHSHEVIDIDGGQSFICEWNNVEIQRVVVGLRYYRELTPFEKFIDILALDNFYTWVIFITIAVFIVGIVFIIKDQKKRKSI